MSYQKLPFEQYFIDQSQRRNQGTPRFAVPYKKIEYTCRHGHKHDAFYCVLFDAARDVIQIYFKETSTRSQ